MMPPPVLSALRTATKGVHQSLEAVTFGDRILSGTLQPAEYHRLLEWQQRAHQSLEPLVTGFVAGPYRYLPRFHSQPGPTPPPSLAERIGLLYVLEGSSLGGSLIYRKLLANPALAKEGPFSFYQRQAELGVGQWRSYLDYLKTVVLTEDEVRIAVRSALDAFARFRTEWEALD